MNPEYKLFTKQNPCDDLRAMAKSMSIQRKWKIAPHIRRADSQIKKAQSFRDILTDEDNLLYDTIATAFVVYFDQKVDRRGFIAVASDPAYDFVKFIDRLSKDGMQIDDKYREKITRLVANQSDSIDAFIKAFISIRLATRELKKLLK